jgi:predicted extracellular nuclease
MLDYSFGNFKLLVTAPFTPTLKGLSVERAMLPTAAQLSVASFNFENLDPADDPAKFAGLASHIVNHLHAPDVIAVQEIQDNSGAIDDGTVDASLTYSTLIASIAASGGPTYAYRDIAPIDGADGGEPGGNIRTGFLFRPDRVAFIDRPGGDAMTPVSVTLGASGVELSISPGRISPTHAAFNDSRKPLAGEFAFQGRKVFVIANHFNAKSGDDPLFGRVQPPIRHTEAKRLQMAQVVNEFADAILALDPNANVIVLGDLNDFPFSAPITILSGGVLTDLMSTLPPGEQYDFIFDGNSQALGNILISQNLRNGAAVDFDIVHVNAEFAPTTRHSDHDPLLARFGFGPVGETSHRIYLPAIFKSTTVGQRLPGPILPRLLIEQGTLERESELE